MLEKSTKEKIMKTFKYLKNYFGKFNTKKYIYFNN